MPQNNARYTAVWPFACQDGTPLYLTENGQSGGMPLTLTASFRSSPYNPPAFTLSTTGGELQILPPPDDNELYVEISADLMKTLAPGEYLTDFIATPDDVPYGSYIFPVTQGITDIP